MINFPVSQPSLTELEREFLFKAFDSGQLTHGPIVEDFENEFAKLVESDHAVACSSGTAALHLALAASLDPGDEVLVPDVSFIATANAVVYSGAIPVLCDINPGNWGINLESAEKKLTSKTKAIVVVHLYGEPVNMDEINKFAGKHGLLVFEDACEGLGGFFKNKPLGSLSFAGTFSFFGNKVITTGEGGMVVTDNEVLAQKMRHLRGQGQSAKLRYFHTKLGFNYRMTQLQAAIGLAQIHRFDEIVEKRQMVMNIYRHIFSQNKIECSSSEAAPWLFTILIPDGVDRQKLQSYLLMNFGIDTRPSFIPMHNQPMYLAPEDDFPVSSDFGRRGLSLPTYPDLSQEDTSKIALTVCALLKKAK